MVEVVALTRPMGEVGVSVKGVVVRVAARDAVKVVSNSIHLEVEVEVEVEVVEEEGSHNSK